MSDQSPHCDDASLGLPTHSTADAATSEGASGEAAGVEVLPPLRVKWWRRKALEADAADGCELRVPPDELLEFIARSDRLAALSREKAAAVEAAYKEGATTRSRWLPSEIANMTLADHAHRIADDWLASQSRAALEGKAK